MHTSMILDPDACMYDAANFVPNGRTDEQGDSRSLKIKMLTKFQPYPSSEATPPPHTHFRFLQIPNKFINSESLFRYKRYHACILSFMYHIQESEDVHSGGGGGGLNIGGGGGGR